MVFFGCMVSRAKAGSSRQSVWIYSETHSFMFRRVSFSTSLLTRCMEADTTSSSLIAARRSICSCRARFFSACLASHSALRFASAASCSARRFSSSASLDAPFPTGTSVLMSTASSHPPSSSMGSSSGASIISAETEDAASEPGWGAASFRGWTDELLTGGTGSSSKLSSSSKAFSPVSAVADGLRPSCISSDISEKYPIVNSFL